MVSKYGTQKGIQRYKCATCKRVFHGGTRIDYSLLWSEYVWGKQTYKQLALKYKCSAKTIQRKLDRVQPIARKTFAAKANVVMDTTYFGRRFGVMVFKNSIDGQLLLKQYVKHETIQLYLEGIEEITRRGINVQSIICDGRKGVLKAFEKDRPVQMCQFHQIAIVGRYLTKRPKLQASKELWEHTRAMAKSDKESFISGLDAWHTRWKSFLDEQQTDEKGKKRYRHKRLRSAYRSL